MSDHRYDAEQKRCVEGHLARLTEKLAEAKEHAANNEKEKAFLAVDAAHWAKLDAIDCLPVFVLSDKEVSFADLYRLLWDLRRLLKDAVPAARDGASEATRNQVKERLRILRERARSVGEGRWPADVSGAFTLMSGLLDRLAELFDGAVIPQGDFEEVHYELVIAVNAALTAIGEAFGFDARQIFHSLEAIDLGLEQLMGFTSRTPIPRDEFTRTVEQVENEKRDLEGGIAGIPESH